MNIRAIVDAYTRRLGLGDVVAPSVDPDEFENVGGFQLPKNFQVVVDRAIQMESLAQHPGWKLVLDELGKVAKARLAVLVEAEYADPIVTKGLTDKWRESEWHVRDLEEILVVAIRERDTMMADLSGKYGTDAEDIMGDAKIVGQMKQQLKRDGLIAVDPEELFSDEVS